MYVFRSANLACFSSSRLAMKWTVPDYNTPGGPLAFTVTQVSRNPHTYMPQKSCIHYCIPDHANKEITKNE